MEERGRPWVGSQKGVRPVAAQPPAGRGSQGGRALPNREGRARAALLRLTYLQLLYRLPAFADDQTHFGRGDENLLDSAVAV